ncbi:MAG: hypothetical protein H7338_02445, partial [Candidatus Sericytochromatia bacterium]|nr:hypothetical protein [Candidatus Sericytochromatia bacterium]
AAAFLAGCTGDLPTQSPADILAAGRQPDAIGTADSGAEPAALATQYFQWRG